eukprot:765838-Hanusia_phi.AAC.9
MILILVRAHHCSDRLAMLACKDSEREEFRIGVLSLVVHRIYWKIKSGAKMKKQQITSPRSVVLHGQGMARWWRSPQPYAAISIATGNRDALSAEGNSCDFWGRQTGPESHAKGTPRALCLREMIFFSRLQSVPHLHLPASIAPPPARPSPTQLSLRVLHTASTTARNVCNVYNDCRF